MAAPKASEGPFTGDQGRLQYCAHNAILQAMVWVERSGFVERARELFSRYPVVCFLGPRQCGKTSLVRSTWPSFEYLDLELPSDASKILSDPQLYLSSRSGPVAIDEAQRAPEIFPVIRALVDQDRKATGRFLLLGSASFALVDAINESLSGRVGFVDLTPLRADELEGHPEALQNHWLKGGFPDALLQGPERRLNFDWFEHYTRTLIERDLPSLGVEVSPQQFRRLWHMCAHAHGELLNMNKLAESLGASPHTVRRYLDILEQSFLIRRLPPFHPNIKKRLVKSPKLYIRDSGLLHYFHRIITDDELIVSPQRGTSFEGYAVEQLIRVSRLLTPEIDTYFFRTSDQYEADLVFTKGRSITVVEIKAGTNIARRTVTRLEKTMEMLDAPRGFVFTPSDDSYPLTNSISCIGMRRWLANGAPAFW